jgi:signal transduction histidine kinase
MSITRRARLLEYAVALVATAAASGLVLALQRMGYTGLSPLLGAVVVSAWYGGIGPGMVSLVLSSMIAYRLLPRHGGLGADNVDLLRTAVFAVVALLASALHFVTRRAREMAERARDAAERARAAAEEASAAKTRFLAMVSHELRNPLSPVLMAVALVESDPVIADRAREELETIRRNVALQVRLIDDLLDVARHSHGKLRLTMMDVNLHDPLQAAISNCQDGVQEKRLELRVRLDATDTVVTGDAGRLQQVFCNLLRNAIKFTPDGGWIAVRSSNDSDGWVAIEVADSGVGIEQNRISRIFMAFEQGGEKMTRRFGGLGLGLSICAALTEAHGGTIAAASEGPGKGATFTVRIPLRPPAVVPAQEHLKRSLTARA